MSVAEIVKAHHQVLPDDMAARIKVLTEILMLVSGEDFHIIDGALKRCEAVLSREEAVASSRNDPLLRHFQAEEQRRLYAWKSSELSYAEDRRTVSGESDASIRELYVSLVSPPRMTRPQAEHTLQPSFPGR
eukprot:PhM_4_TR16751/c0_g1_i4/m.26868